MSVAQRRRMGAPTSIYETGSGPSTNDDLYDPYFDSTEAQYAINVLGERRRKK